MSHGTGSSKVTSQGLSRPFLKTFTVVFPYPTEPPESPRMNFSIQAQILDFGEAETRWIWKIVVISGKILATPLLYLDGISTGTITADKVDKVNEGAPVGHLLILIQY